MATDRISYDLACIPALKQCLELMEERRKKYADGWKDNKEYQMLGLVAEKFKRLEHQFENPTENSYETKEDTLIDLVNWALFYLQNLKDGKYKNRDN